jgi:hypothetical protein
MKYSEERRGFFSRQAPRCCANVVAVPVHSSCPACHSADVQWVESVSVEELALAWAREKCHGEDSSVETKPDQIFSQIGEVADQDAQIVIGCPSDLRYTRRFAHPQRLDRSDFWDYPPPSTRCAGRRRP